MIYDYGFLVLEVYVAKDKRQLRKERRLVQSESRWMQKALFALGKAETAREKLAKARKEELEPETVKVGGNSLTLDNLRDAIQDRVETLAEVLQERREVTR